MATLYVRNVPEPLYEQLRRQAGLSRRSISAEAVAVLEEALGAETQISLDEFLARADRIRATTRRREDVPTIVESIREDRDR